jgi:hypothetical protein
MPMDLSLAARTRQLHISDTPGTGAKILPPENLTWARIHPGEWQYFVDPDADKSAIQQRNLIGGRLAGDDGQFVDQWLNPDFIPTPGYANREIACELELVIWRIDFGFNNVGHFADAFARSDLIMLLSEDDPTGQRGWPLEEINGDQVLKVYTSAHTLPKDVNPWLRRTVSGRDVLEQVCPLQDAWILFNLHAYEYVELSGANLIRWWGELQTAKSSSTGTDSGGQ